MNIAIILAAGFGTRFESELPKQFANLANKPLFLHAVEKFLLHKKIHKTFLVVNEKYLPEYQKYLKDYDIEIIFGGKRRQDSVLNALEKAKKFKPEKILVHDAARPFLKNDLISNILKKITKAKTVIVPALKSNDSLRQNISGKNVTLNRDKIYRMQTPQGGFFEDFYYLQKKYQEQNLTDDAGFFEIEPDYHIDLISGDHSNEKITYASDLEKHQKYFHDIQNLRIGLGSDIHRFSEEISDTEIKISGIAIKHEREIIAHSDGDVALHAITDALLGACAMGDIGEFFPDNDPQFKDHDSEIFLKIILKEAKKYNLHILNLDLIIICEAPKLQPYKEAMTQNLARILEIDPEKINIKGKTNEKLDAIGEKKAIAAYANILIQILK